jgi:translation initiation factor IF-2
MSGRKLILLLATDSNLLIPKGMNRPRFFQTSSRLFKEQPVNDRGLGMPKMGTNKKKTGGITKTNWQRKAPTPAGHAPKRDWSRPVDLHSEKHAGESQKLHEKHVNKFSKPAPKKSETTAQKKERKKREEELSALAKEEEKERRQIELRKAKQKQKQKEEMESNKIKDVYIPEIINVANLSKVLGVRIGNISSNSL